MDKDLKPLNKIEIAKNLKSFKGWSYKDNKITKEFTLDSFSKVIRLLNILTPFCNKIDHHPDIHIYYKKVVFELQRFSVGGKVTQRDFKVAKKIETIYKDISKKDKTNKK